MLRRLALLIVNLSLALLIGRTVEPAVDRGAVTATAVPMSRSSTAAAVDALPLRRPATGSANLFRPADAPVAVPAPLDIVKRMRLVGIVQGESGDVAVIERANDPNPARLRLGMLVDGWRVTEIRRKSLVLERAGETATLTLDAIQR